MALIFGFVVRTTTIGFAVVEQDPPAGTGAIRRLGVRVFPEPRDRTGTPTNQTRRAARLRRRQLRRRRERRRALQELLEHAGLLPARDSAEWRRIMQADPYELRRRAFAGKEGEALSPHEIGRAVYHLAQHRHVKQPDVEGVDDAWDDDPEDRDVAARRAATVARLREEGKTLGAWLAERGTQERRRGHPATRELVQHEFDAVWAPLLPEELRAPVRDAIFFQRPVFWRLSALRRCPLVPDARVCPKGSWPAQQARMLAGLNRVTVLTRAEDADADAERPLDPDERIALRSALQTHESLTWAGVRRALRPVYRARGLPDASRELRFNLEREGVRQLAGNVLEARLAAAFGPAWAEHPRRDDVRQAAWEELWDAEYAQVGTQRIVIRDADERAVRRAAAARRFVAEFGLPEERAEQLETLRLPRGWGRYSAAALEALLPHLEAGIRLESLVSGPEKEQWRAAAFGQGAESRTEAPERLPSPADPAERRRQARLENPTLVRSSNELRKVVNNLIDLFGKPDVIRVELAEDLARSKRRRDEERRKRLRLERRRAAGRQALLEQGLRDPTPEDVEKWLLWEECGGVCPYTGREISLAALFRDSEFDVEFVWPRSRSLDDSFWNKTLCPSDLRRRKGSRTPLELLGGESDAWVETRKRLEAADGEAAPGGMHPAKARRFLGETPPADFAARQREDRSRLAREVAAHLGQLWDDAGQAAVEVVSARVTRQLRRHWSLDAALQDRGAGSYLSHALDGLAAACCDVDATRQLAAYWGAVEAGREVGLTPPWEDLVADARTALSEVVVSHRTSRKVSGLLHRETVYGDTGEEETRRGSTYRTFVTRKPVDALTARERNTETRDAGVARLVRAWADRQGDEETAPTLGSGREVRRIRLRKQMRPDLMARVGTGYAELHNNHHLAVYRYADGRACHEVVSLLEAARRVARGEPVVRRARADGAEFVMSLAIGEALQLVRDGVRGVRVVKSVWGNGQLVVVDHDDAAGATRFTPGANTLVSNGARKVAVDPIGRVRDAND